MTTGTDGSMTSTALPGRGEANRRTRCTVQTCFRRFSQISVVGGEAGGVAYMAHIGGFVAGVALIFVFRGTRAPPLRQVLR